MKRVAVLMGGWSAEREVSLRSGNACADAVQDRYDVIRIDVDKTVVENLREAKPDVVLNMLHGPFGEDGTMQGVLEFLEIPYSHSGVLASAAAMSKPTARKLFEVAGIPVAQGKTVTVQDFNRARPLPMPFVIKPVNDGSSVGVSIVREEKDIPEELPLGTWKYGNTLLVEEYIPGRELTCAVRGYEALSVIEITSDLAFYDYEAKYAPGGSKHILPAQISHDVYKRVQDLALAAHQALGCRGVTRSDFRYDDTGDKLVILETNTQPGMTATSLVPEMAAHDGMPFPELVSWMIEDASLKR